MVRHLEHPRVGREHAELGGQVFALERVAGRIDDEGADPPFAARLVGRIGKHDHRVGDAAVGNEILDAAQQKVVSHAAKAAGHFQRIAPGFGLGQPEGQNPFAGDRRWKIFLLLRFVAEAEDRVLTDRCVAGEKRPHARPLAADPRQRSGISHGIGPAAAKLGRHGHAQQIVFLGQRDELLVEPMLEVAQFLDGPQLLAEAFDIFEKGGHGSREQGAGSGDFRFQISDFRFQISDFRFQISDFESRISNLKSQISNLSFQCGGDSSRACRCKPTHSASTGGL